MDRRRYTTRGTRARITEALLDSVADVLREHGNPDELIVRDTELKGFALRLRATGRHTFGVAYGRGKFLTLGASDAVTTGKARKAARDAIAQTSLEGAPVRAVQKATRTLEIFLDQHYETWANANLKGAAETLQRLRVTFKPFLDTKLAEITPFAIERWRTARAAEGVTRATINRDITCLRSALSKAVAWHQVKTHPMLGVRPFKADSRAVVRFLSAAEEKALRLPLTARDNTRRAERESANRWRRERGYSEWATFATYTDHLHPLVLLALQTGLRRGELFGLRWLDVDVVGARLTVHGYGAKSGLTRHVPLNTEAVTVLKTWCGETTPDEGGLVFPSPDDPKKPLEDIKTAWLKLAGTAKLRAFRFHDLKHTFASKLVQRGVDLNTVRELLGHSDIKMVLRYAHLAPEHTALAVEKLVGA
jgi:integrase